MRAVFLSLLLLLSLPAAAQTERRVALVIGVDHYDNVRGLTNPGPDAQRIYDALKTTGFDLPAPLLNPSKAELDAALLEFSRRADGAAVAVLYYAGHGMQQFDDNWIIPRDARLLRPQDIRVEGERLQDIVGFMGGAQLRIIILDACRNNPFTAAWPQTMSPADGLARLPNEAVPAGTVIAYSAGPRQTAPDNGAYAHSLATHMLEQGVELRTVLDRTNADVAQGANVTPDATIALNTASFYFVRPLVAAGLTVEELQEQLQRARAENGQLSQQLAQLSAGSSGSGAPFVAAADVVAPMTPFLRDLDTDQIAKIMRGPGNANPRALSLARALLAHRDALDRARINTPLRLAHFLGQVAVETAGFSRFEENLNYSADRLRSVWPSRFADDNTAQAYAHHPEMLANYVYANRAGNGPEASGDGWRFRSRGAFPVFGRENYNRLGQLLNIDLMVNPDRLTDPEFAFAVAAYTWTVDRYHGRALNDLADADDVSSLTLAFNGGLIGLSDRQAWTALAKSVLSPTTANTTP